MKAKHKIINDILQSIYFKDKPPVLIDIGASEKINSKWEQIAFFSICLAFDADDRDFKLTEENTSSFKRLIKINRIVETENKNKQLFYLHQLKNGSLQKDILAENKAFLFECSSNLQGSPSHHQVFHYK